MSTVKEQKLLKAFGRNLASARKGRGLTQQELAERLNMSVVSIAYLETGKRWARAGTLQKIAKALKINIRELFIGL